MTVVDTAADGVNLVGHSKSYCQVQAVELFSQGELAHEYCRLVPTTVLQ